ncbi:hypothetical protein SERLA73DRAFT_129598, partial [Serpula lacrymans var. lacrymans S7.3]
MGTATGIVSETTNGSILMSTMSTMTLLIYFPNVCFRISTLAPHCSITLGLSSFPCFGLFLGPRI